MNVITTEQKESNPFRHANEYNAATWQYHLPKEVARFGPNWELLSRRHKSGNALGIQDAPKAAPGTPCICIGSGPSADKAFPLLKDWKGGIICSSSQSQTLRRWGVEPDYVIALDSVTNPEEFGPACLWKGTKTALVSQPGVKTETIAYWKWKSYWFRKFEPIADEPQIAYQFIQPIMFNDGVDENGLPKTWIPAHFVMLASVAPALMFVAKFLGYSPVILSGVDFGWREHTRARFTASTYDERADKWTDHPTQISDMMSGEHDESKVMTADNGAYTNGIQVFYKRNFFLGIRLDKWPIYDAGRGGCMDELPYVDIEQVIRSQGKDLPPIDETALTERIDAYLAKQKTYVVEWNGGMAFVESDDFMREFPIAFGQMKRQGSKDTDLLKNMRRLCKAHGIVPTAEQEAEWLRVMERVASQPPIEAIANVMDRRLMAIDKKVDELLQHPSMGLSADIRHGVKDIKGILKGDFDAKKE